MLWGVWPHTPVYARTHPSVRPHTHPRAANPLLGPLSCTTTEYRPRILHGCKYGPWEHFKGTLFHECTAAHPWPHTHSWWPYTPFTQSYKVLSLGANSSKSLEWFSIVSSGEIPSFDSYVCHYMLLGSSWVRGFTWHSTSYTGLSLKSLAQVEFIPLHFPCSF